ncbi:YhaN family protein [Marichromatium bheemlicum]|uniref:AAA family ATPase n=1 Tax=Marichromatium bheemlicum TaxID=365339 RepID=A0ABX1I6B4_9GAMM|nr:YhaN family protein [Marichromatium bheemlicum]NKN32494.1 AAA family ATPase [Marichromatium bheemlicum]
MRLLRLELRAFGPFTDRVLDLSAGEAGLHLVYGHNEAGKSSALRALHGLFYGIPERTRDDFCHPARALRIGAVLVSAAGERLYCVRRKGRKHTLLDAHGEPLEEASLQRLLGGVDAGGFARLFGIDHETLVSGGRTLLEERGREAEALFGSGLGRVAVHRVLSELDEAAAALFRPRGRKPLINAALSARADLQRRQREVELSVHDWQQACAERDAAHQALVTLDRERDQVLRERARLERIRRTRADLELRRGVLARLAELGERLHLPEDFAARRHQAETQRIRAIESRELVSARLATLEQALAGIVVDDRVLAAGAELAALRERLGSHRKAAADRSMLVARRDALQARVVERVARVDAEAAATPTEALHDWLDVRRRVNALGERRETLWGERQRARLARDRAEQTLVECERQLAACDPPRSSTSLELALDQARGAGGLDAELAELAAEARALEQHCATARARLNGWELEVEALLKVPLPEPETLEHWVARAEALDQEQQRLHERRQRCEQEANTIAAELRTLEGDGEVPSEAALLAMRETREEHWAALKAYQGSMQQETGRALASRFEQALRDADTLADRLRRESDRVQRYQSLQRRDEACAHERAACRDVADELEAAAEDFETAWQALWRECALARPLPPRQMRAWLNQALRLREQVERWVAVRNQRQALEQRRHECLGLLRKVLSALGETPPAEHEGINLWIGESTRVLDRLHHQAHIHAACISALSEARQAREHARSGAEQAEREWSVWARDWGEAMTRIGLAIHCLPAEAQEHLAELAEALQDAREAAGFQTRIDDIDTDAQHFVAELRARVAHLAPDLVDAPVELALETLDTRLEHMRAQQERHDELQRQHDEAQRQLEMATGALRGAEAQLADLCNQAGCREADELAGVEERARLQRELEQQLEAIEVRLLEAGDGLALERLENEAGAEDIAGEALLETLAQIERRLDETLDPERERRLAVRVEAEHRLAAMDGTDTAASVAEEIAGIDAQLHDQCARYLRYRLAARVLRETIERFRRSHRDPILARTAEAFTRLTCGAFSGVESDFGDDDQAVLVGIRDNGERVRVEAMSTGTRDQLYLALRLAGLEHHLGQAEPLPFIVDDILVQFDDTRARATLETLALFSDQTQVILFTHHQHLLELAQSVDPDGRRVFIHRLDQV